MSLFRNSSNKSKCPKCEQELEPHDGRGHIMEHLYNDYVTFFPEDADDFGPDFWTKVKENHNKRAMTRDSDRVQDCYKETGETSHKTIKKSKASQVKDLEQKVREFVSLDLKNEKLAKGGKHGGGKSGKKSKKSGKRCGKKSGKRSGPPHEKEQMEGKKQFEENSLSEVEDDTSDGLKKENRWGVLWGESESIAPSISDEDEEAAAEKTDMSEIFLEALIKIHGHYLEAASASDDKYAKNLENLASRLSTTCASFARRDPSVSILNIVKAGIGYAFTEAPLRLSFLIIAVIHFASELETPCFPEILTDLEERTMKVDLNESSWMDYETFVDNLNDIYFEKGHAEATQGSLAKSEVSLALAWERPNLGCEGSDFESAGICDLYIRNSEADEGTSKPNEEKGSSGRQTGRDGEQFAYDFFSSKFNNVTWVNGVKEEGLPYDISIQANDKSTQYIEVKTTTAANKNWFNLSVNEYEYASIYGASFLIARVVLTKGQLTKITTFRDPVGLLKSRKLKLLVRHHL